MQRRSLRSLRFLLAAVCCALACFSDSPTGGGGNEGTTGDMCRSGSLGCPCDADACDEGLTCESSIARCIDPTCTPGMSLCTCVDGLCLQGLECTDGLCRDPEVSTGTPTTGTTSSPGTGDPSVGPGSGVTSTDPTTATTSPSFDLGTPDCQSLSCVDCRACVVTTGDCTMPAAECQNVPACTAVAECALPCTDGDDACVSFCCELHGDGANTLYNNAVANCVEMACPGCTPDLTCAG